MKRVMVMIVTRSSITLSKLRKSPDIYDNISSIVQTTEGFSDQRYSRLTYKKVCYPMPLEYDKTIYMSGIKRGARHVNHLNDKAMMLAM